MPDNLLLWLHDDIVFQPYAIEERYFLGDDEHRGTHHFRVIDAESRRRIDDQLTLEAAINVIRELQIEATEQVA